MKFLSLVLAFLKAFPALKETWDELVAAYVNAEIARIKKENREAIRKAINEQDQRDIERALGSSKAGEASGIPDSDIVDKLPGVNFMQDRL